MMTVELTLNSLSKLIREVSANVEVCNADGIVEAVLPLRTFVEPMCHVGKGALMDSSDEGYRMQMEWYAGQLLSMVDEKQWTGINSWINCTDKFTTRKEDK